MEWHMNKDHLFVGRESQGDDQDMTEQEEWWSLGAPSDRAPSSLSSILRVGRFIVGAYVAVQLVKTFRMVVTAYTLHALHSPSDVDEEEGETLEELDMTLSDAVHQSDWMNIDRNNNVLPINGSAWMEPGDER